MKARAIPYPHQPPSRGDNMIYIILSYVKFAITILFLSKFQFSEHHMSDVTSSNNVTYVIIKGYEIYTFLFYFEIINKIHKK